MDKTETKEKRLAFNWRDGVTLGVLLTLTAGVFIWSFVSMRSSSGASHVLVTFNNQEVASNLMVTSKSGEQMDYVLSFRRELMDASSSQTGKDEAYVKSCGDEYTDNPITVASLREITDFSSYKKTYFIVTADELTPELDGFKGNGSGLYGPQVDLKVISGSLQVIKEDSPEHDCSKQGQVSFTNLPLVCLPNNINFRLVADGSSSGPDA